MSRSTKTPSNPYRHRIATALALMLRRRSMSAARLAGDPRCPVNERSVGAYLRGERDIPSGTLVSLCVVLDCTVAQLLALAASVD